MPCSETKRLTNRANARKSTGPKSRDGKQKVAMNALKHGLRSAQVVLPGEDAAAFDGMVATWMADWQPPTDARRVLVELAVAHAWRLRRCLKLERDHLLERRREAIREAELLDRGRTGDFLDHLDVDPEGAVKEMRAGREGTIALLGFWEGLAAAARSPKAWNDEYMHHERMLALLGHPSHAEADDLSGPALASLRLVEWNRTSRRDPNPAGRAEAAAWAAELEAFVAEEVARVTAYLGSAFGRAEEVEARRAELSGLDDSPEGRALLRYEGQHGREFRATLNQLVRLTQTDADVVEDDEEAAEVSTQIVIIEELKSYEPAAPNKATGPSEMASEGPSEPATAPEFDPIGGGLDTSRARNRVRRPRTPRSDR
jgi:hypothetical protein